MIGYWDARRPIVPRDCPDVKATSFVVPAQRVLVAIASWSESEAVTCSFSVQWSEIGMDPTAAKLSAPDLPDVGQTAHQSIPINTLTAEHGHSFSFTVGADPSRSQRGAVLVLETRTIVARD